jgi:hypothetical protein
MGPKRVITSNDKEVAKYLQEAVQLLKLMEKPNITVVRKDINECYGVGIPYHTTLRNHFLGITRPYREAYHSQQLLSPEAECVLVDVFDLLGTRTMHSQERWDQSRGLTWSTLHMHWKSGKSHTVKKSLRKKDSRPNQLINSHFDSHPEKRQDTRFEGIFNSQRRPRVS